MDRFPGDELAVKFYALDLKKAPPCPPEEFNIFSLAARLKALEQKVDKNATAVSAITKKSDEENTAWPKLSSGAACQLAVPHVLHPPKAKHQPPRPEVKLPESQPKVPVRNSLHPVPEVITVTNEWQIQCRVKETHPCCSKGCL